MTGSHWINRILSLFDRFFPQAKVKLSDSAKKEQEPPSSKQEDI